MRTARRLVTAAGVCAVAAWLAAPQLAARQVAPGAPSNLTYLVNGQSVSLQWTHSTGTFTHYRLEAGGAPGETFFIFDTSALVNPLLLPQLLASFAAGGIGPADYYVRMKGMNGAVESAPSNEVVVPIRTSCVAPGTPTNYTAIVRGTYGMLQWNAGSGGQPTAYILLASYVPNDPNPPIVAPIGATSLALDIPPATYYSSIFAVNACGASARSNEIVVTTPGNTPARTPDPPAGQRLPQPDISGLVLQVLGPAARAQGLLNGNVACPSRPGYSDSDIEARKVNLNAYINFMVDNLRNFDTRFGYNSKPTRANAIIAGDEITYHYGSDPAEGSPNVYPVDLLGGHCTFGSENVTYRPFYNEFARWTAAGRLTP